MKRVQHDSPERRQEGDPASPWDSESPLRVKHPQREVRAPPASPPPGKPLQVQVPRPAEAPGTISYRRLGGTGAAGEGEGAGICILHELPGDSTIHGSL